MNTVISQKINFLPKRLYIGIRAKYVLLVAVGS